MVEAWIIRQNRYNTWDDEFEQFSAELKALCLRYKAEVERV